MNHGPVAVHVGCTAEHRSLMHLIEPMHHALFFSHGCFVYSKYLQGESMSGQSHYNLMPSRVTVHNVGKNCASSCERPHLITPLFDWAHTARGLYGGSVLRVSET